MLLAGGLERERIWPHRPATAPPVACRVPRAITVNLEDGQHQKLLAVRHTEGALRKIALFHEQAACSSMLSCEVMGAIRLVVFSP